MVREYELMYIVRPDLDEDGLRAAMDSVQGLVEAQGGELLKTTHWGKRRLAYEIQRLRDGHYVLLAVRLDGAKVKELERALRINDNVIRHLVTVDVVGKWATEDGRGDEAAVPVAAAAGFDDESQRPSAAELDRDDDEEEV
jgi:small subunit ribosomal protein S6